ALLLAPAGNEVVQLSHVVRRIQPGIAAAVADADAAAEVEFIKRSTELLLHMRVELKHPSGRGHEWLSLQHLAADVAMQSDEFQLRMAQHLPDRLLRQTTFQVEAELAVLLAGLHVTVR